MKKILVILLILISAFLGCTTIDQDNNTMPDVTYTPETGTEQATVNTSQSSDEITVSGTYVGLIDNNSFEVIVDSVPTAFRHTDSPSFIENANINEGDSVTIVYTQNEYGQNIALSITLETEKSLSNLFPISVNVYKKYQGIGNEYAEYETTSEFATKDKIQIKSVNAGTSIVNVYKVTKNYVKKVYTEGEVYDIADFTKKVNNDEIILKTPIEVGTTWNIDDKAIRTITAVDKSIETPYSPFKAVEVKTEYENSIVYDYYVANIGHVMTIFEDKETKEQIISELLSLEKLNFSK